MPKKDGTVIARFKNKLITKNTKLNNEQLIQYIIDKYPHMLEKVLEHINDTDSDEQIKEKFSNVNGAVRGAETSATTVADGVRRMKTVADAA